MLYILAAVAAVSTALAELTLGSYLTIGTATPHLVLVFAVIWTISLGVEGGLVWAFVGGLALDILAQRPIGSSAFALLVAVGIAALIGGLFGRARLFAPILSAFICSLVYSVLLLITSVALQGPTGISDPVRVFLPGAIYDTVIAAVVGPLAVAVVVKRREAERVEW